jgi:hypothetical protein
MSVIHDFTKQIFRAAEKAPPPPKVLRRRWGSSGSFQPKVVSLVFGFEALRIVVKILYKIDILSIL